jgi:hypothetical protein
MILISVYSRFAALTGHSWILRPSTQIEPSTNLLARKEPYADFVVELVSRGIASDGEPADDGRGTTVSRGPASARGKHKIPVEGPERRQKT